MSHQPAPLNIVPRGETLTRSPLVSVIIPTYNRAREVGPAIESVAAQTYAPLEIIVVDDGSTDDTLAVLRRFEERVHVIGQQNSGPATARNTGVRASQGEVIAFLDSDDLWLPGKIERQVKVLERAGSSVCCCVSNMELCFVDGRHHTSFDSARIRSWHQEGIWLNPAEVLATRFLMFNQGVAIRREAFEKAGGFDEQLRVLEDYDLALRLSLYGPWAFVQEPLVVWKQRRDSVSYTLKDSPMSSEAWLRALKNAFAGALAAPQYARARRLARRQFRIARRVLAARELADSDNRAGRLAGKAYLRAHRAWDSCCARFPWYPRMKAITVEEYQEGRGLADIGRSPEPGIQKAVALPPR